MVGWSVGWLNGCGDRRLRVSALTVLDGALLLHALVAALADDALCPIALFDDQRSPDWDAALLVDALAGLHQRELETDGVHHVVGLESNRPT